MNKQRAELHLHTTMSVMDGVSTVTDYIKAAIQEKLSAIAITDHASVQSFPEAYKTMSKYADSGPSLKLIYGNEIYMVDDISKNEKVNSYKGMKLHASVLAVNKTGLKNLYKLVSLANTDYFYKVPRTPKSELKKYREGLLIGSGCDCGELYYAIADGVSDDKLLEIASFYDYLEVVPIDNFGYYVDNYYVENYEGFVAINKKIVEIGDKAGKLVVAVSDAHYAYESDDICRNILLNYKGYEDYSNQPDLSMRTTDEMLEEFQYLGDEKAYEIVVVNSNKIADMVDDLFSPIDTDINYQADIGELVALTYEKLGEKYGENIPQECLDRIDEELSVIGQNERNIYNILLSAKLVGGATEEGLTVGTRGSVASSYIAYLLGITEINPLEAHYFCPNCNYIEFHNEYNCGTDMEDKICRCGTKLQKDGFTIPHETFFGIDGVRNVDIDFNFPPEYQREAFEHLKEIVDSETIRCGRIVTLSEKAARIMVDEYCEKEDIMLSEDQINKLVEKLSHVKRTTGMHPGGVFVIPKGKEITDYTPVQYPADRKETGVTTTPFDCYPLMDLLKIDILGHDMPSMLKHLEKLTGVKSKDIPLDDKKTQKLFSEMRTCGIPEFGTQYIREYLMYKIDMDSFDNLIRISGFAHGTDVWYENGENLIEEGIKISDIVSCRDDVMLYLVSRGLEKNEAFRISERIRKGMGLTDDQYNMLVDNGVEKWRLDSWNKIKYLFPRAHCASYVLIAYRVAYYKAHYPLEFYCAYFSMNADRFDSDLLVNNADVLYQKIERLKNSKELSFNTQKLDMMEVCQEMYDSGFEFVSDYIKNDTFESFFIEDGKLRPKLRYK